MSGILFFIFASCEPLMGEECFTINHIECIPPISSIINIVAYLFPFVVELENCPKIQFDFRSDPSRFTLVLSLTIG